MFAPPRVADIVIMKIWGLAPRRPTQKASVRVARVGRGWRRDLFLWEVTQKCSCKSWVTLDLQERLWLISHRIMKQIIQRHNADVELCRSGIPRALVAWGRLIYFNAFTVAERNLARRTQAIYHEANYISRVGILNFNNEPMSARTAVLKKLRIVVLFSMYIVPNTYD